ncbi:class I adenylate-forming enzyme family protein [Silicimonas sp. MF1-12-2]|uniref:class I adenylate-forming enzyme family protein n=1 Tax=Silicimonas sp. MF1-12-2 TaxID=3384793 RepID=UPI0039B5650E
MLSVEDHRTDLDPPARFSLAHHVLWANGASDDKIALTVLKPSGSERWSYGRLRDSVLATGAALVQAGLEPGDRLLLRLGNTTEFPLAFLGAVAAGIVPVPSSAALNETEIARIADVLRPKAVLCAPGIALPPGLPVLSMAELEAAEPLTGVIEGDPERPGYVVFTSGTSNAPVGVVHAHRAILARRMMFDGWYGLTVEDRILHAGAFNWTYTLGTGLLDPWTVGATALIPGPGVTPDMLPLLIRRHEATLLAASPGVFRRILRAEPAPFPKLRHGLSAGEKLSESLRERWRDRMGTDLHEAFGQSECSTFISGSPTRPAPAGTLGYAQPGRAVAILGPDGAVPRGETGEIAVHKSDPGLILGYLGDATPRLDGDWFRTGDMGQMREDGAIVYAGRNDDVLTAGGFRLSPLEIEEAMSRCPGVHDAAAVDHALDAETVVVALHYAADAPIPETVLRAHATQHLARHKQPRLFVHHASLPRNPNGKLLRRALRTDNEAGS